MHQTKKIFKSPFYFSRHLLRNFFVVLFLLIAISTIAQTAKAGTINGTVKDTAGQVLEGVEVIRYESFDNGDGTLSWWWSGSIYTDSNGQYAFEGSDSLQPDEKYRLEFSSNTHGFEFYNDAATISDATDIVMAANQERTIDIVLGDLAGGGISGTVTDNANNPIQGIYVYLTYKDGPNWTSAVNAQTDSDGKYSFPVLPANDYRVEFQAYSQGFVSEYFDNANSPDESSVITLTAGDNKIADAVLDKKGVLRGTVKDTAGQVLEGVEVIRYERFDNGDGTFSWVWFESIYTDSNGQYAFEGYDSLQPDEKYRLEFSSNTHGFEFYDDVATISDATDIVMVANQERTIDIVLGDLAGGGISGTVTDNANNPIQGIYVYLTYKDGQNWTSAVNAQTGSDGKYSFAVLPANDYRVEFQAYSQGFVSEYFDNANSPDESSVITLTAGDNKIADAVLDKKGVLRGTVKDTTGQVLEGVEVRRYESFDNGNGTLSWWWFESIYTDSNGQYAFEGYNSLQPDEKYRLEFSSNTHGFEFYNDAATIDDAADIVMTANQERVINIILGAPNKHNLDAMAVPTLQQWALVLLVILLFMIGWQANSRKQ